MKLTLPQKVALIICCLWTLPTIAMCINEGKWMGVLLFGILAPLAFLWITGTLKPLLEWLKDK